MITSKPQCCWIVIVCLHAAASEAATPLEVQRRTAPMPHVALAASAPSVKANWVRLEGYLEGVPDNATRIRDMKARSAQCVASRRGDSVNPPSSWPDFMLSNRQDQYHSANFSITYVRSLGYELSPLTCGLVEAYSSTAVLKSGKGTCTIDLVAKTAVGACGGAATGAPTPFERVKALAAAHLGSAAQAAAAARPAPAAQHKTILGLECAVRPNPADDGGTFCVTAATPSFRHGAIEDTGMLLEMTSARANVLKAVEVKLDASVSAAVFAPHLAGGYAINQGGAKP